MPLRPHPGIMLPMANQAYLSVWCKNFSEERMLEDFGKFLGTVPFSAAKPGFAYLIVRAVDARESPMLEQDLRSVPLDAGGIIEIAAITCTGTPPMKCIATGTFGHLMPRGAGNWSRSLWKYSATAKSMTRDSGRRAGTSR